MSAVPWHPGVLNPGEVLERMRRGIPSMEVIHPSVWWSDSTGSATAASYLDSPSAYEESEALIRDGWFPVASVFGVVSPGGNVGIFFSILKEYEEQEDVEKLVVQSVQGFRQLKALEGTDIGLQIGGGDGPLWREED